MLELRGVDFDAGGTAILKSASVRFRPGRFNVILGPNGAGKSTLLKVATGLLKATVGDVLYDGQPVAAFSAEALARKRAVLSQHVDLAFPLAAEDVVLMGRYPHYARTASPRDREIVTGALELVGMADRRNQSYPTLSGGEKQKVQLARVLAQIWNVDNDSTVPGEHRYLFLDEPTTSLDIHYQLHLLNVTRNLAGPGCTVVAVLHDLNVAFRYGDSFFLMERGRMVREADHVEDIPADVIERVFQVRAERLQSSGQGAAYWEFRL